MARTYTRRNYANEVSSYKNQSISIKRKMYNNIAATINARMRNFDEGSSVASDLMDEIRRLQKRNPEMFTESGNLRRSADINMLDKQFSRLVRVLYTVNENGNPITRMTAKQVNEYAKKQSRENNLKYVKHLQHKAKALGLEKELEQLVGTEAYKAANKRPSDPPEGQEEIFEEEEDMNTNYEQLLEESGLTPEEWLDATTLGYIGHIMRRYGGR